LRQAAGARDDGGAMKASVPLVLGVLLLAVMAAGCGDDDSHNPFPFGSSTAASGAPSTLADILSKPIAALPGGLRAGSTKKRDVTSSEKAAGATDAVRTTLSGGATAYIDFIQFKSDDAAAAYALAFARALPEPSGLAFLPAMPDAACADGPATGSCGLAFGSVFVVTDSSSVNGQAGAAALLGAVSAYLGHPLDTTAANGSPVATTGPNPTVAPNAACALLTAADAKTALNGPVGAVRQGGDSCDYPGNAPGSSVEVEVYETGRPGFDNARSETQGASSLSGVGDAAFVFSSPAGFVQVSVVKGSTFFVVTVANDADSQRQSRAVTLAKTIAGRVK